MSNGLPLYCCCILATSASTVVPTIIARTTAPALNGPSTLIPNQLPNSSESVNARQTLFRGARSKIFFSIQSVFIRNLQVAYYHPQKTTCNQKVALVRSSFSWVWGKRVPHAPVLRVGLGVLFSGFSFPGCRTLASQ